MGGGAEEKTNRTNDNCKVMGNGDAKCRLCLKTCGKSVTRHSSIFKDDLHTKLMTIAAVKVQENDGLSAYICTNCRNLVRTSYNFKCQVEKSDRDLRRTLVIKDRGFKTSLISNKSDRTVANDCSFKGNARTKSNAVDEEASSKLLSRNRKRTHSAKSCGGSDDDDDDDDEKPLISRTRRYKCNRCIRSFGNATLLEKHATIHRRRQIIYGCYICDKQFLNVADVKEHAIEAHGAQMDEDKIMRNTKIRQLNVRVERMDGSPNDGEPSPDKNYFACKVCDRRFTDYKLHCHHMKTHSDASAELYRNLSKIASSSAESRRPSPKHRSHALRSTTLEKNHVAGTDENHNNNWNGKENQDCTSDEADDKDEDIFSDRVQCKKCGKYVSTVRNLRRHMLIHSDRKFACSICNKEFSRPDKLREHQAIVHKIDLYDGSDTENDYREDSSTIYGNRKKRYLPYKCSLCPKAFAHELSLENHEERHRKPRDNRKRYLCHVCSKCFAQSGSLAAHMRTHTGVKPYVCNVCGRAFTKSTYLQLHLRMHSGEKPYVCQHCDRAFARANTLARHMTVHTGEAKYHCKLCEKSFRRLTSLNEHTYTHTGQKPYSCKICSKRYNNAGSLYAHTKRCKILQATGKLKTADSSAPGTPETASELDAANDFGSQLFDLQPMSNLSAFSSITALENAITFTPSQSLDTPEPHILILTNDVVENLMADETVVDDTCQFIISNAESPKLTADGLSLDMPDLDAIVDFNPKLEKSYF